MKKVFYCDFDGIITDSKSRLIDIYNLNYRPLEEKPINTKDVITWDCGVPKHLVEIIFCRSDFFSDSLKIHDGAIRGLQMLKERGYEVVLYSKGAIVNLSNKLNWVNENLDGLFSGWFVSGSNELKMVKNQLDMSIPKEEGFSILFDDCYTNLVCDDDDKLKHHMPSYSICGKLSHRKDEEWNMKFTNENLIAYHWDDLKKILDKIENYEINVIR